ncbi:MAG: glycosyltransferase [Opitutales bacterium]
MIFHSELSKPKREGGLELAVYDITKALNSHTGLTHARLGDHYPATLKGVQAVHFHGLWSQSHLKLARQCRKEDIPYIVSPHGMLEPWALGSKRIKKWIHRVLFTNRYLSNAQTLLATSEIERANIQKLFPRAHVSMVPLGIRELPELDRREMRQTVGVPGDVFHLVYLSRIDSKKNLLALIESLPKAVEHSSGKVHLTIIGDGRGRYIKHCMETARKVRGSDIQIDFKGPIWDDSKRHWLAAADLFCLPSSSENFGYAYLEALSVGTPILTSKFTPWAAHADEPFVFCPEPEPNAIAEQIALAIREDSSGAGAIKLVESRYMWDKLVPEYAALYPSLDSHEETQN